MTNMLTPVPRDPKVQFVNTLFREDPLILPPGDQLQSLNGAFQLILQAADGNLVLYIVRSFPLTRKIGGPHTLPPSRFTSHGLVKPFVRERAMGPPEQGPGPNGLVVYLTAVVGVADEKCGAERG